MQRHVALSLMFSERASGQHEAAGSTGGPRETRFSSLTSRSPSEGRMCRPQTRWPGPGRAEGWGQDQGSPGGGEEGSCRGFGARAGRMGTLALGVDGERQGRAARQKPATGQSTNSRRQTSTPRLRERVRTPVVETCLLSWAEGWRPTGPPRQ